MNPIRIWRRAVPLALACALATPGAALAHAELSSSAPADGATLDSPPSEVVLVFEGELLPAESEFDVVAADGTEVGGGSVDLAVAERNEMRGDVDIDAEGAYTIRWTAATPDGHEAQSGEIRFTYETDSAAAGGGGATSNTAVSTERWPDIAPLGAVLLGLGAVLLGIFGTVALRRAHGAR